MDKKYIQKSFITDMPLEQIAKEDVQQNCDHCGKELLIPVETYELSRRLQKTHDNNTLGYANLNFFISFCGGIFCSRNCNALYTED